jgi:hypothetical protein
MPRPLLFSARVYRDKPQPFRLYAYDIATQQYQLLTPTQPQNADSDTRPSLSPDGAHVLFLRQQGLERQLWVRVLSSGKSRVLLPREPSSFGWQDNNTCWVAASEGALEYRVHLIHINNISTTGLRKTRTLVGDYEPIWSPNKTQYAFSEREGEWRIVSVNSNKITTLALTATTLIWGSDDTLWALGTPGKHAPTGNVPQEIQQINTAGKVLKRLPLQYSGDTNTQLQTRLTASWHRLLWLPFVPNTLLLYGRMTPSRYLGVRCDTNTGVVTPWGEFGGQVLPLNTPYCATLGDTTDTLDPSGNYQRTRTLYRLDVNRPEPRTPLISDLIQIHSLSN